MAQILVVDDEVGIRELLSEILEDEGHQVALAESAGDARRIRERARPDLVLLDIWMPDTDGITLLKEWAASGPEEAPRAARAACRAADAARRTRHAARAVRAALGAGGRAVRRRSRDARGAALRAARQGRGRRAVPGRSQPPGARRAAPSRVPAAARRQI